MRALSPPPPMTGKVKTIPAPIGGLNARDALANMPETDAVILDNFFPQTTWVETRNGASNIATFAGVAETVSAYNGFTFQQMYAAVRNGATRSIFRVDGLSGGPVGAAVVGGAGGTVQAINSSRYDWAQYSSGAVNALYLVNGVDPLLMYDGTTWRAITAVSAPYAITGAAATSTFTSVAVYHQRLWFTIAGSLSVAYLPINALAGAAIVLDLGALFKLGGALVGIITVSIDNSQGTNDYIAFVSNQGEIIVYLGFDPASTTTWALSAHFRTGVPVAAGRRMWQKIGSDAALVCSDGLVTLSEELLTDRTQQVNAISDKIRKGINDAIAEFGGEFGWQVMIYPLGNKLIVNVPTSEDVSSYGFVMNMLNGSWCTFGLLASSWNATCYEILNDQLYCGTVGAVMQVDVGGNDNGNSITCLGQQAYSYFDAPGQQKTWHLARPIFVVNGALSVALSLSVDFNPALPSGLVPISQGNSAIWNVSLWTTPTFWGDAQIVSKQWIGIGGLGYAAGLQLQVQPLNVNLQWQATSFVYENAGLV